MRPSSTISRLARFLSVALVATLCAVVAPASPRAAKAAGIGTIDYFATTTTANYFTVGDNNVFDNTGDFTFEAWIKPDATCIAAAYACMIANKENSWEYGITSGQLYYALANTSGGWSWNNTGAFIRADVWTHVALSVQRSTNTLRTYINGTLYSTAVNSTNIPNPGNNSGNNFTIGGRSGNTSDRYSGGMDEVRIYGNVRSQANIQSDMNTYGTAAGADTSGLTAYYDFNIGSGTSLANDAPSAASGTALTAASTPTWTDIKTVSTTYSSTVVTFPRSYLVSAGGWTVPSNVTKVDALIVGGGGGGGGGNDSTGWSGGGGGAGGYKTLTNSAVTSNAVVRVSVGGGGMRGTLNASLTGTNGTGSQFNTTSVSGGGFGSQSGVQAGSGSSGGGGAYGNATAAGTPGTGISGEGFAGGSAPTGCCAGGGGGGSASVGGSTTSTVGGAAGNGTSNSITGTATFYAAGGAGQGTGGGGSAGSAGGVAVGASGGANTGSGGGGGGGSSNWTTPGFGGNGVVIVKYAYTTALGSTNRYIQLTGTQASGITVPDNNALDFTTDFTAEVWLYNNGTDAYYRTFLMKESAYGFSSYNGTIYYAFTGDWAWRATTITISTTGWTHLAFSKIGTTLTVYKNGGVLAGGSEQVLTVTNSTNQSTDLQIGKRAGSNTDSFNGWMDELRLWNYGRSASEVALNYNQHIAGNVATYTFDEDTVGTVYNSAASTGSTLNGTSTGITMQSNNTAAFATSFPAGNLSGFLQGVDMNATSPSTTFSITTAPTKGTIAVTNSSTGAYTYTPNIGATGSDSFTYQVAGTQSSTSSTVSINIPTAPQPSALRFTQGNNATATVGTATNLGYGTSQATVYTNGETISATVSATNGTVAATASGSATLSGSGTSSFTVYGSQTDVNSTLNSATITATSAKPTRVTLDIAMRGVDQTISSRTYKYNSNGHFYTLITSGASTQPAAVVTASGMTLGGRTGYLATILSASENSTAASTLSSGQAWIGFTDSATEGTWLWSGNDFSIGSWSGRAANYNPAGTNVRGRFPNWNSGEPNDSSSNEDWAEIDASGYWNDCGSACGRSQAVVEFDPTQSRVVRNIDFTQASTLGATVNGARSLGYGSSFIDTTTWNKSETAQVTLTAAAGVVNVTTTGLTVTAGASGTSTISMEGTVANMNTALSTATTTQSATGNTTVTMSLGVKCVNAGSYKCNTANGHFYYAAAAANIATSTSNATSATFAGTPGYLATVTDGVEDQFIRTNIASANSWFGLSDSVSEGQMTYNAPDAYQIVSQGERALGGAYAQWNSGEPNSSGNQGVLFFGTNNAFWDDQGDTTIASIQEFTPITTTVTTNVTTVGALSITTPSSGLSATVGSAYSLTSGVASGGQTPYTYAIASGTLPDGLSINSSTGEISGTPTNAPQSQAITVRVTDANTATATTSSFTLTTAATTCASPTTSTVGVDTVVKFTGTGICTWTVPAGITSIDAFVVGAGGGGGADGGGGGGGGGMQPRSGISVTPGDVITIRVGAGGTPGIWGGGAGSAGGVSSISTNSTTLVTANGGSAGTSGPSQAAGAGGTSTNGYAGGSGGTASTIGGTYGTVGKAGGVNYFLGSAAYYGGGGAGGMYDSTVANGTVLACTAGGTAGGTGGGGSAGIRSGSSHSVGCDGTANTGGGGGGGVAGGTQTSGGAGGSGIAMIRYTTDSGSAFPASIGTPAYRYIADDFQNADSTRLKWIDSSGNGRSSVSVSGTPGVATISGNGAGSGRAITGGIADAVRFSSFTPSVTNKYTLFHVARLSGATKKRILDGVTTNWLSGYWNGSVGVNWHGNWMTPSSNTGTTMTNWQMMTDQNQMLRQNGVNKTTNATLAQNFDTQLAINAGYYGIGGGGLSTYDERSDFNAAEIILYDGELTAAQIRQVESYLARKYSLQGLDFNNTSYGVNGVAQLALAKTGTATTGQTDRLTATWTLPGDTTGITDFTVEYKKSTDSTWTTWSHTASATLATATITGLLAGTQYDVRVTPVDSGATNRPVQSVTQVATWLTSSVTLGSLPASPRAGTAYSITATSTSGTTGTVNFKVGGTSITGCSAVTLSSSVATCSWTPSSAGSASVTAEYSGDTVYLAGSTVSASSVTVLNAICSPSSATSGRYTVHRMLTAQTCDYTSLPAGVESVDVFVLGAGGGGGENAGSGGGGGGAYYAERVAATSASTLTVTVGAGGRAGNYPTDSTTYSALRDGGNGDASSITWSTNTFTGAGGVGGQTHWTLNQCGGGTAVRETTTSPGGSGSGTGGTSSTGGAGGLNAFDVNYNATAGGNGFSNSITGTATTYGGGGGGGAWGTGIGGSAGTGGGGVGGGNTTTAAAGTANTGGGGGGGFAGCAAGGAGGSGIAIVRYANVPTITTQPTGASKNAAQSYTFSVTPSATGAVAGDFSYQWRKGGVDISGATSSTLVFSSLLVADAGTYSVVVKNSGSSGAVSSVTSADAVLTVNQATQSITFGTLADRVYGVSPITLSATASSGLTVSFISTTTSVCTVSGTTLTVINTGTCSIKASQAGSVDYLAANDVFQSFSVTTKTLTITGMTAANKEYDRSTSATPSFTGASLVGVVGSDTVTIDSSGATATFADKTVANGKTVTAAGVLLGGAQAARYTVTQPTATANITAKALTITGITANNRVYDSTTSATALLNKGSAALSGVIGADVVTLSTTGATATFADKNIGSNKTVTIVGNTISGGDSANYTLTQPTTTASITAKELTVTGITANNKVYDASTSATSLLVKGSAALAGIQGGDTVTLSTSGATATFADKTIGTGKTVAIAGLSISGTDYTNYTLTQPTTTASITAREITVTGITASDRVYDATNVATSQLNTSGATAVGIQGSDDVVLVKSGATATFTNKAIGVGKTVYVANLSLSGTDIGNYTLTQPTTTASITAKELTVSGITANNKVYDGLASATALLNKGSAALVGVVSPDVVNLATGSATATFADKNVGTAKPITIAGLTISGTDYTNYTLTQPTTSADITTKTLTVTGVSASNKVYDQNTTAQLTTSSPAFIGVVSGDTVTISTSGIAGTFANKNVGNSKAVTITGVTKSGADAGNYTITQPSATANITAKTLTVTGITASNRNYDGTTTAQINTGSAAFSGVIAGDAVTIDTTAATGTFADANFGTGKVVTIAGVTSTGSDANNYSITQPTTNADIARKTLTVTGITATSRTYNGSTSATANLVTTGAALAGIENNDALTLDVSTIAGVYADKNAGTGKTITISGITVSGTNASNYTLVQPTVTGTITTKRIYVVNITANNKVYDGNTDATALLNKGTAALSGVVNGDAVTLSTSGAAAVFGSAVTGTSKPITISGLTISGTDAANYNLTQPSTTANITPKELTVTGVTGSNRIYDGTTAADGNIDVTNAVLQGVVGADDVVLDTSSPTATFADKNVGTNKVITVANLTLIGGAIGNYTLTQPTTTASITTKTLTITGITASSKVYNASTAATLVKTSPALAGVISGDVVTLSTTGAAGTFSSKTVGNNKTVTITGNTISGTDAGNYTLVQPSASANITAKTLTVPGITTSNRTYNASANATGLLNTTSAALVGVESGDTVNLSTSGIAATFADKTVGTAKAITVTGVTISGGDYTNYSLTQPTGLTASITQKTLTVSNVSATSRVYNATTSATSILQLGSAALVGIETGDTVTIDTSAATGSFDDKTVGTGKTITLAGISIAGADYANYSLTQPTTTGDITSRTLTISGITANNKVYDATASATALLNKGSAALVGIQGSDVVTLSTTGATATFADKNIGTAKTVTIIGNTISGTDAGNYTLTQPSTTASITARTLTISGVTANNRVYDATRDATALLNLASATLVGIQGSDVVTLSTTGATATFADKNIGTAKTVTIIGNTISGTDAGNYTLTQPTTTANITAKELTISGITANDRVYNASTSATALLNKGSAALVGIQGSDVVTLSTTGATATFADKNIGTAKTVTIIGNTISGTDAGNYTLTQPTTTANITAKELTISGITASNKVYNASTAATLVKNSPALVGVETNDVVTLSTTGASGTFANKNIGTQIVTIIGNTISGTDAGNYTLTQPTTTASITVKTLTVSGITANNRVYNASTDATAQLVTGSAALVGVETNDTVGLDLTSIAGAFATKIVGTAKAITISGIVLTGADRTNYVLTQPSASANVTAKTLTVSGITATTRIYDGTTAAALNSTSAALVGVETNDAVTLNTSSAVGAFTDASVATGKTVTISGITIAGNDAGNYSLTQPTTTADILTASAGLAWTAPANIVYGTTLSATQLNATANVAGTFTYNPPLATRLTAGTHTLSVSFTPTNSAYDPDSTTVSITVTKKQLTVSGITANDRVYDSTVDATTLLNKGSAALVGIQTNDTITLDTSAATATFATKTIGSNKTISIAGITFGGTEAANYTLTQPTTTASITAKELTISGITANNKVYDALTTASLVRTSAALVGIQGSDVVTLSTSGATATFADKNIGTAKTVTIAGNTISGTDAANYTLTQPTTTASITARTLTVSGITANNRVYDASNSATDLLNKGSAALVDIQGSDVVTLSTTGATATFATKNIGTAKTVFVAGLSIGGTDAGNYTLTQPTTTASITAKTLTISGITANNRVYDATNDATALLNKGAATLDGVQGQDNITFSMSSATATFATKNIGTAKTVTIAGNTISGTDASNYTLIQPTTTASITAQELTISGITANNKVYDALTTASLVRTSAALVGIQGLDVVTLTTTGATGTFADKNIGTAKTVTIAGNTISGTDASNYTLTQPTTTASITAKELTVSGITANNRVYDATNDATALLNKGSAALVGIQGSDAVTLLTSAATATFATKTIGTAKTVYVADLSISGTDASNYTLTQPTTTANITAKELTVSGITANNRVYDSTRDATSLLNKGSASLVGVQGNDDINFSTNSTTALFATKTIGSNKTVTIAGITFSGNDAGNYTLTQPTTTASITAQELTVSGITANNRVYDSTVNATALLNKGSATLVGIQGLDVVTLSTNGATATFADKTIGTAKTVTIAGNTISGTDASNYTLTQPTTTANITAKNLTIANITANNKVYDATTSATNLLNLGTAALVGIQSSDVVTLSTTGATATFADKTIGTAKTVSIAGNTISGTDAANYTLTQPTTTANITAKTLTIANITANNKVYDATTSATNLLNLGTAALVGIQGLDDITLSTLGATATFATKSVGTNKTVTIIGNTIGGADVSNYTLTQPTTTASITAKELTVSGITTMSRAYNGTVSATALVNTNSANIVGKQGSDSVAADFTSLAATFGDANVGTNKPVTISGIVLTGTDSTNYALTQPSATATITQATAGLAWSNPADITFGDSLNSTELNATASVAGTYAYTPTSGTRLAAGTHTLSVTFTPTSGNYAVATTTVSLTVNTKAITVTAINETITYGTAVNSQISVTGLASGDAADAATYTYAGTGSTSYPSTTTAPVTAGTYSATPSVLTLSTGSVSNYAITYVAGTLTINKAAQAVLTAVPNNTTVTYAPAPNKTTVSLSTSGGSGDGAVTYAVANGDPCTISGTTLTVDGAGACAVTATKATGTNHLARSSAPVTITIDKAAQTLSLNSIGSKTYGDNDFAVTTSATSALTVSLTASPVSVCTVTAHVVHIVSNGNCTITASQSGDANWLAATVAAGSSDSRTFTIATKVLTITGTTTTGRAYNGSANASSLLNFSASTLVGVVTGDSVTLDASNAAGAFATETVGINKPITVSNLALTGTHASRYSLSAPTTLTATVTALPITVLGITVPTRVYNTTNIATLSTSSYSFTDVVAGDSVTLDDSNYVATFANANVSPTAKTVTVSGLALSGADAQNYVLTQPTLQGLITKATGSVLFAQSRVAVYDMSPKQLATSTSPSSLSLIHEYNGTGTTTYGPTSNAPTNAGTYSLLATINDINYQGSATSPWTIQKQTVGVVINGASTTFSGTPHVLTAASTPSGKNMVVTYGGVNGTVYNSTFAPVNAGTYSVSAVVEEANYDGNETASLVIAKASQTAITFLDTNTAEYGVPHQLVAVGGSGSGALTYSQVSGPCTVNFTTGMLTPTGAGACVVQASRAASTNFLEASSATRTVTISKGSQTIAFTSIVPSTPVKDSTYSPTATATSGLPATVSITSGGGVACSMSGGVVTFLASGLCTITATQPGNDNYVAASSVSQSIEVGKINQTITFAQPSAIRFGDPSVELGASSSSGLTVAYSVTNGASVCSVSAAGILSALSTGSCTIEASQTGDSIYGAANPVVRVVVVGASVPSQPHIASISSGDSTLTVGYIAPSSNGGAPIASYTVIATSSTAPTVTKSDCGISPLSCTLLGLVNGASYTVTVAANNISGTGPASETADVLIPAPTLEAVRSVAGTRDLTSLDVTWDDPVSFGDGSFVRYEVAIRERNGLYDSPVTVQSLSAGQTARQTITRFAPTAEWVGNESIVRATTTQARSVRFSNLNPAVTYETRIVTITTTHVQQTSTNTASALMLPLRVPNVVRALNIDAPDGRTAKVSWSAPVSDGGSALTQYTITSSNGTCVHASALATSCVITQLTPGTNLSVSVVAENAVGQSIATTATMTTPATPGVPVISYVTATTSTATISWTAPQVTGGRAIVAYSVVATSSTNASDIARCSTVATTCQLVGLTENTNYKVKVRAHNSVGAGAYSSDFSLDTPKTPINTSEWDTYRKAAPAIASSQSVNQLPPAPARVTAQSTAANRTLVTAIRAPKDANIPVTFAIISVTLSATNKLLTRIKVRVDPANPTTTVSVPFASRKVRVNVQFANDIGISAGGPVGGNVAEGNTFESTTVAGEPRIVGTEVPGSAYFAKGSALLTPALKSRLKIVATTAKSRGGLVYVTGFASPGELRSAWLLDALARARAEAVAKFLAAQGVRQWITFHGAETTGSDWERVRERKVVVSTAGINQV